MNLTLDLTKPGDEKPKLQLNLQKEENFEVFLAWEGKTDLDLHALHCRNTGSGGKVTSLDDILSIYNVKRIVEGKGEVGYLPKNPDGTFEIYGGALKHSPDATDGDQADIDESIKIYPSRLSIPPGGAIEIPILSMIHPQNAGMCFKNVQKAWLSVVNSSGQEIARITLSDQFGEFTGVQAGSIMIDASGTSYVPVGVGFSCDFNTVLANFT